MRVRTLRMLAFLALALGGLAVARPRHRPARQRPVALPPAAEPRSAGTTAPGARTQVLQERSRDVGPALGGRSAWSSADACRAELAAGRRAPRTPGAARLAAWNIRWFPDGGPGDAVRSGKGPLPTNVAWLACAIAWLDVEVIAFEELKSTRRATDALGELKAQLASLTGSTFHLELDRCPGAGRQSVGLLYDERRVTADAFHNVAPLNPSGNACDGLLRPGFGGYFHFPGGADVHFVAAHLKSGPDRREYELRKASFAGFHRAYDDLQAIRQDGDVVIAGDFNTMGCPGCQPRVGAEAEVEELAATLAGLAVPFRSIPATPGCSEYYRGEGKLLDHFAVAGGMREVGPRARARVEGYCAEASCSRLDSRKMPAAYRQLSDHCPVVLEIDDRDLD